MVCFLRTVTAFRSGFFRLLFLVIVFGQASAFNGDLSHWDVSEVTDMNYCKSIRIVEIALDVT